ncbi:hypothetical protein EC991_008442 [Linnemannia zychae]|nr:hypothetical protein EC991_008442 [Linnemannia zychae]
MGKEDKNHFKLPKPYEKAPISTHKSTANLAAAPEHRASNEAKAMVSNEQNDNHLSSNYNQLGNNQFHNRQAFKNNRHRLYNNQVHSSNIYSSLVHPSLVYKRHASHDTQNSTPAGRCPFNNTEGAFSASAIFGQRARGIPFKTHTEKDLSRGPLFNQVLNATFFANHVRHSHWNASRGLSYGENNGGQYHHGAHYQGHSRWNASRRLSYEENNGSPHHYGARYQGHSHWNISRDFSYGENNGRSRHYGTHYQGHSHWNISYGFSYGGNYRRPLNGIHHLNPPAHRANGNNILSRGMSASVHPQAVKAHMPRMELHLQPWSSYQHYSRGTPADEPSCTADSSLGGNSANHDSDTHDIWKEQLVRNTNSNRVNEIKESLRALSRCK